MRISDWSSDVCSSDLLLTAPVDCLRLPPDLRALLEPAPAFLDTQPVIGLWPAATLAELQAILADGSDLAVRAYARRIEARAVRSDFVAANINRSEEHKAELQSLKRNSYAVFFFEKKKK